jgi:hypothetical protein
MGMSPGTVAADALRLRARFVRLGMVVADVFAFRPNRPPPASCQPRRRAGV